MACDRTKASARQLFGMGMMLTQPRRANSPVDFSNAFARINRPMLFAYEPGLQPNANYVKAKLGDKVQLVRFDGDGHALFVDDPVKFNRMVDEFVQGLPK
jgi:pimeloyl-ACP methyl ester carboxylesterase